MQLPAPGCLRRRLLPSVPPEASDESRDCHAAAGCGHWAAAWRLGVVAEPTVPVAHRSCQ